MAFQEKKDSKYIGISWNDFIDDIQSIAANLARLGFAKGDKMVLFSRNRLEMLQMELAIMASGGVSVPIYANFIQEPAETLIRHCDAKFLAVAGQGHLDRIDPSLPMDKIFVFDDVADKRFTNLFSFRDLLRRPAEGTSAFLTDTDPHETCLNMYTSGTMGDLKCVQLSHHNILSQQAALDILWDIDENDVFLSYLPWHHSFGGIFEKFTALYNGATISIESSYGKDAREIMENWNLVRPTVFFSVPKVYQELVSLALEDKEVERAFFHPGLKFIFTAAAALPHNISVEFEKRNIAIIEGYGLTETSPCCTLTDPVLKREQGVVGNPIPGVSIRLEDDGEILVKGPNIMSGYYKNDILNKQVFTEDGYFRTGDLGEISPDGLKIMGRKDRIFKLLNAEKVLPSELEDNIRDKCNFITYALVEGDGQSYPVVLLFPNKRLIESARQGKDIKIDQCVCPKSLDELSVCLGRCLNEVNIELKQKFARIKKAMIVDDELSVENKTLTPSMKLIPKNIKSLYRAHVMKMYGEDASLEQNVFLITLGD